MTRPETWLAQDLDHILDYTRDLWGDARGARLFLTGGTGFVGRWLLESYAWANDRLALGSSAVVLTRAPEAFRRVAPGIAAHPALSYCTGRMQSFAHPDGMFSHVIHAATESSPGGDPLDPLRQFDANVQGTQRVLDFAIARGAIRFLFTSSGAVYGHQPTDMSHIIEDYAGAPSCTDPQSAYGQSKRASEFMCSAYAQAHGLQTTIARGFAFVGPGLPLDANSAIGNFLRDALRGGPITVRGDGTAHRSYLYAADLAIWLWTILFRGQPGRPYNVGSERDLTIAALAREVADAIAPSATIEILGEPSPGRPTERYVPSTQRAKAELGLQAWIPLEEAIRRTAAYYRR
jgi:nucleoside-diphosphate-sugar epimerase